MSGGVGSRTSDKGRDELEQRLMEFSEENRKISHDLRQVALDLALERCKRRRMRAQAQHSTRSHALSLITYLLAKPPTQTHAGGRGPRACAQDCGRFKLVVVGVRRFLLV